MERPTSELSRAKCDNSVLFSARPICARLFQVLTLRLCDYLLIPAAPRTSSKPSTPPLPTASPPFLHIELPLPEGPISSLLARWLTSQDPFLFKRFLNLLCCGTRRRRASAYPHTLLPCNSRVATRSKISINFCKIKQRT